MATPHIPAPPAVPGLRQRLANHGVDGVTLLILPALLFVIAVFIYPFLYGLVLSFNPLEGGGALANYRKFFSDPYLYKTIGATLWLAIPVTVMSVALAVPIALIGWIICRFHARALDAFAFGADAAAALGVPVRRVQLVLIAAAALVTAVMVSMVGSIGFVGLVIPHAARFLVGPCHGRLLPASALMGAVFLIVADVLSRTIIPGQVLPIGVITALAGAPAFALILIRGGRRP